MSNKIQKYLADFYHSFSFKLFLILLMLLCIFVGIYSTISTEMHQKVLENTVRLNAYRISDITKQSLYRLMLLNEREELYQTIQLMGSEPGIENIRIYNKKGEIKFSTKENEISQIVDMKAEACFDCHTADQPIQSLPTQEKTRIYRSTDGRRIMGMINPIRNSPECSNAGCHIHQLDRTILGVLDVQLSLKELDVAMLRTKSLKYIIIFGFIFIVIIPLAVVVYLIIYKPINILKTGTAVLSLGDLDHRIHLQRKDELGSLATSINNMASNLQQADTELRNWSNLLEKKIEEKTSELEQVHKELIQVEKMASLGKMAATVAHELNNPLAGIVTYSKLLIKKIQNNFRQDSEKNKILLKLDHIRSESMRCGNIVRNLLVFARGSSSNFRECVIQEIIDQALKIVKHHIELAKIKSITHFNIQSGTIICDPDQLLQALVAILVNAVEAMPDGGNLEIIAKQPEKDGSHIIIEIRDTGVGVADDVKDRILEPFFSTKKDKNGVGLGLAIVYGIIQRHRGRIWLETQIGKGTTFFIELPITQMETNFDKNRINN